MVKVTTPARRKPGNRLPSPIKQNSADAYLRHYLNSASDWRAFLAAGGDLEQQAAVVTGAYFGQKTLRGAAFLLGTHLLQQVSASAVSLTLRSLTRGSRLGDHNGITVYKLAFRRSGQSEQTIALRKEWNTLRRAVGLKKGAKAHPVVHDHYYFSEGGRSWLCYTLRFPAARNGARDRLLTVLTMLSVPNRGAYFDRPLPFPQAVEWARGCIEARDIPGFIGDVNELDIIMPLLRVLKLLLYGLNWYLVDPEERDSPPSDTTAYNNLTPPDGGNQGGSGRATRYGVSAASAGRRRATPTRRRSTFYGYGAPAPVTGAPPPPAYYGAPAPVDPVTGAPPPAAYYGTPAPVDPVTGAPPPPDYFGAPASPPVQTSFLPQNNAAVTLSEATVDILMSLQNKEGGTEDTWVAVDDAYLALNPYGQPTGLAIAPEITTSNGDLIVNNRKWLVIQTLTGRAIGDGQDTVYAARQLVARLVAVFDWTRNINSMSADERRRVMDIISANASPAYNNNGRVIF